MSLIERHARDRPLAKLTAEELRAIDDVAGAVSPIADAAIAARLETIRELVAREEADRDFADARGVAP